MMNAWRDTRSPSHASHARCSPRSHHDVRVHARSPSDAQSAPVSLAVVNARIWTGNPQAPMGRSDRRARRPDRRRGLERRDPEDGGREREGHRCARPNARAGIQRLRTSTSSARGAGSRGEAARCVHAGGVHRAHQGVREDAFRKARGSPTATGTTRCGVASCPRASGSTPSRLTIPCGLRDSTGT